MTHHHIELVLELLHYPLPQALATQLGGENQTRDKPRGLIFQLKSSAFFEQKGKLAATKSEKGCG